MWEVWIYGLVSVFVISLASLIGVFGLWISGKNLQKILIYLVAFSAGALLGDVFIHLLPELVEEGKFLHHTGVLILGGIVIGLLIEKVLHRNHCHHVTTKAHPHPIALMNLIGDFVHNLIDGLIIGASYLISIPAGIATSVAVLFHEIPQEIGDFWVLVHGGYSKKKALMMNFLTALSAVLGLIIVMVLSSYVENIQSYLIPIAIGMFIYIAGADLIPEVNKHNTNLWSSSLQVLMFLLGAGAMFFILLFEGHAH